MNVSPFLIAVSEFGLPKDVIPIVATGSENFGSLKPDEIARIYWLLKGIEISYSFTINGIHYPARHRAAGEFGEMEPLKRALRPERLIGRDFNEETYVLSLFEWNLGELFRSSTGSYAYDFIFESHSYPFREVYVSMNRLNGYELLDSRQFEFLGKMLTFYLQTNYVGIGMTGQLGPISIAPEFWEFDETR